jgi:hypothetical protein
MAVSFDWSHASQSGPLKLAVPWPYTKLSDKLAPVARGYKNGKWVLLVSSSEAR